MDTSAIDQLGSSAFGIVILIIIGILALLAFLMPLIVFLIHNDVRVLLNLAKERKSTDKTIETEILMQTKLLADIRKALQSMEAVGIEVEQSTEPEYTAPPVPQSIGPRRHQLRH
jgi:5-bromo-4-chloroindolyl phosphate hydrolysis protein